ncbi:MAG: NYN domain-containing protein [bacterium]|nr:NYN domain-containing protein [bacterium]
MTHESKKILDSLNGETVGVFIDDGNIFHRQKETGLYIDWKNFGLLLKKYCNVKFLKFYRGSYPNDWKIDVKIRENNNKFVKMLTGFGYEVVNRDIKKIFTNKEKTVFEYKCDFDAKIGFDIGRLLQEIQLIIVVTGDSDFSFLDSELGRLGKKSLVICHRYKAPWEFFRITHIFFEEIIEEIVYKHKNTGLKGPVKNTRTSLANIRRVVK